MFHLHAKYRPQGVFCQSRWCQHRNDGKATENSGRRSRWSIGHMFIAVACFPAFLAAPPTEAHLFISTSTNRIKISLSSDPGAPEESWPFSLSWLFRFLVSYANRKLCRWCVMAAVVEGASLGSPLTSENAPQHSKGQPRPTLPLIRNWPQKEIDEGRSG